MLSLIDRSISREDFTARNAVLFPGFKCRGMALNDDQIELLAAEVKDYQITHGSLLKMVGYETESTVPARPVNVSLVPTPFLATAFDNASELQPIFNELYMKVADDEEWLSEALGPLLDHDVFFAALWNIHLEVQQAGIVQPIVCGIFRSDYMLHIVPQYRGLKQVEMNTFSVAGACHAERVARMHQYLRRIRSMEESFSPGGRLVQNENTRSLVKLLREAHQAYGNSKTPTRKTCVLMIVQPENFNIADERPIEYGLWEEDIPCYRCAWQDILEETTLNKDRTLSFQPSNKSSPLEVSVIYYRAGYQAAEYNNTGKEARLRLELSRAIKCPDVLTHLTTFKAVQQALTKCGAIERCLSPEKAKQVRSTFMPMQILDMSSKGLEARAIVADRERMKDYILKPNLEGGGNNVYGEEIADFLKSVPEREWQKYILMEKIQAPYEEGVLMMVDGIYQGSVVSELGVLGTCLWERGDKGVKVLSNGTAGWTFKTKPADVDEMSVVKGYGCFDSPELVGE